MTDTDEDHTDMTCAACGQVIGWHVAYHYREDGSVVHSLCPRVGTVTDIDDLLIARLETYVQLQRERPNEPMAIPDLAEEAAAALRAARDENEQLQAKLDEATKAKWWTPTTEGP